MSDHLTDSLRYAMRYRRRPLERALRDPARDSALWMILALFVAMIVIALVALGASLHNDRMIEACAAGRPFTALGDPAATYRCIRVIDYPPTQGQP